MFPASEFNWDSSFDDRGGGIVMICLNENMVLLLIDKEFVHRYEIRRYFIYNKIDIVISKP